MRMQQNVEAVTYVCVMFYGVFAGGGNDVTTCAVLSTENLLKSWSDAEYMKLINKFFVRQVFAGNSIGFV